MNKILIYLFLFPVLLVNVIGNSYSKDIGNRSIEVLPKNICVTTPSVPTFSIYTMVGDEFYLSPNGSCGSASFQVIGTPGSGGNTIRWYSTSTSTTALTQATTFFTPLLTSDRTYYISTYNTTTACESGKIPVLIKVNPIPGIPVASSVAKCGPGQATLTGTVGTNGTTIRWFDNNVSTYPYIATGTSYSTASLESSAVYYARSHNQTSGCYSNPVTVNVTINPLPGIPMGGQADVIYGGGFTTLNASIGQNGDKVRWYDSKNSSTILLEGTTFTTPTLLQTKSYYIDTYNSITQCKSERIGIPVIVLPILPPSSTVREERIRVQGIVSDLQIAPLTIAQKSTVVTYLDGLMRANQVVVLQGSKGGYDIVSPMIYDNQGRNSRQLLSYVATTSDGSYKSDFLQKQLEFYQASNDKVANDSQPFSQAIYSADPSGRILEQGGIGQLRQPGGGNTKRITYALNSGASANNAEEVRQFKSDGTSSGFYAANKLYKQTILDEDEKIVIVYTDSRGKLLAKKQQLNENINGSLVDYLETYYIYDDFDRVKYIISPGGIKALKDNGWNFSAILNQYVYQLTYDSFGRVIEKKDPGKAVAYFVYDPLGRLVLAQDGLLRAQNKWLFTKYDKQKREVATGFYKNTTELTQSAMSVYLLGLYKSTNVDYPDNAWFESRGTTLHGYSNISFPKSNRDGTSLEILNVNFYDGYDFDDADNVNDFSYVNRGLTGEAPKFPVSNFGFYTGSKKLVMDGTNAKWIYTYLFYDRNGNLIQARTNNHLNSTIDNLTTLVLNFEGKPTIKEVYHNAGVSGITKVTNRYTYDVNGRLSKVHQNNNALPEQLIAQYEYNELGQVVDKKLHEITINSQQFLQSVDFRYNIQGQLSSINNASLTSDLGATNDESNDYFGLELLYETQDLALGNASMFNGNISAVKWKSPGMAPNVSWVPEKSAYKFTYDQSNQLKSAVSVGSNGTSWNMESNTLNETVAYDYNGNIKSLTRNQPKHQFSGTVASYISETIDNLTYTYSSTMNDQLLKVEDATASIVGFNNGSSGTSNDFTYDVNGNVTSDLNKGISSIVYNLFGKPTTITFTNGRKVEYVYDAAGTKISMKSFGENGTPVTTTDYVGGFVYENAVLNFFAMPEGRIVNNSGTLEYQYNITDHQGNTRVVFSSLQPQPDAPLATFEGNASDRSAEFINGSLNIVPYVGANTTPGGSRVVRMNQSNSIGPAKSVKVFPGDKVDIEVWEYHEGSSGYGTSGAPLVNLITAVSGVFTTGLTNPAEIAMINAGVNSSFSAYGSGGNRGASAPAAYLNFILFDVNYKVLDAGWQPAPATTFTKQKLSFATKTINEPGYIFVWLSYEGLSNNYVYFDDFKITHTKTNVVQYNEYYPYGLQTSNSWTRTGTTNRYLYNSGSELNATTGIYETQYRGYDPALGRFMQIDPLAAQEEQLYQYAGNNPVMFNDPTGLYKSIPNYEAYIANQRKYLADYRAALSFASGQNDWSDQWFKGSEFNDWSLSGGSDIYRDMLAAGYDNLGIGTWRKNDGDLLVLIDGGIEDSYTVYEWDNDPNSPLFGQFTGVPTKEWIPFEFQGQQATQGGGQVDGLNSNNGLNWTDAWAGIINIVGGSNDVSLYQMTKGYKAVAIASKDVYLASKSLGTKLGVAGLAITGYDIYDKGLNTSRTIDVVMGGVAFIPMFGWAVSGTYFVGNLITIGITGQSIGDHIQRKVTGQDGTKSWKPWGD